MRLNCIVQIEEVQLNSSTRSMMHMHKKLSLVFSSLLHSLRHTLLGLFCCMQTCFYLEEVSRHYQPYLQRSATRKVTGKISLFSSGISLASHSTIDTIYIYIYIYTLSTTTEPHFVLANNSYLLTLN